MDDGRERPSLVDDPDFLANLDGLDQGLGGRPVAEAPPFVRGVAPPPDLPPSRRSDPAPAAAPSPRRYETFYGLTEPPFALEPDTRFLFHSTAHDQASEQLRNGLERRGGILVLAGPAGIGKTILCRALVERLDGQWLTSIVGAPIASFDDLVRNMLAGFRVAGQDDLAGRAALLVIDDAQNVAAHVLADLQRLAAGPTENLHILLVGEPSIRRVLGRAELRGLGERVADWVALAPLAPDEVAGYVMHRIQVAGMGPRVEFDDESLALLYETSGGVPRAVNVIADRALAIAFGSASSVIDASIVEAAATDVGAVEPVSRGREFLEIMAIGLLLALLASLGAGAAAWVFRDRVHDAIVEWQAR